MTNATVPWSPVTDTFGALLDLELGAGLADDVLTDLGALFHERGLLVFRDQDVDLATQRRLVSSVGTPFFDEVDFISHQHGNKGELLAEPRDPDPRTVAFHSDLAFDQRMPIHGISLYAQSVDSASPRAQGERFVSSRRAFLALSAGEVAELDGRTMISLHSLDLSTEEQAVLRDVSFDEIADKVTWSAQHQVLYPHPRTGERVLLYVPWFAHSIFGMTTDESRRWFARFDQLLYADETDIYTHRWEQGDVLFWDNLALQHSKEPLPGDAPPGPLPVRVLRRVACGPQEPNLY